MNARPSIRERFQQVREDAILDAVNRLLSAKGYDHMTVDEVAAEAGVAKASLYKHFTSKEELAGAAMIRALREASSFVESLRGPGTQGDNGPLDRLRDVACWAMRRQLQGHMPSLPSQNSSLTESLRGNALYVDLLLELSNRLGTWIAQAQTSGQISAEVPAELVLYTIFARACDPVVGMLKASGQYADEQIVQWVSATTFDGLRPRP